MADISKCNSTICPWKENCYRYKAKGSMIWQAYINPPGYYKFPLRPDDEITWICDMYWPMEERSK